jgi:hypothetical protein
MRIKMLPDFPKIKNKLNHGTYLYIMKNFHQTPLLSSMKKQIHFEGDGFSIQDEDNSKKSKYKEFSSRFEISDDDLLNKGLMAYVEGILGAIEEMNNEGEKLVIERLKEASEKSGNIVKHKGKLTTDDILEMYEMATISFDENGNHGYVFYGGDDCKEAIDELKSNPEYVEKYRKIIEKKRQEWNDRENNRKLVD